MSISSWKTYYEWDCENIPDSPDLVKSESRRARAQYDCSYCHRTIMKGHRYIRHFFVLDNKAHSQKQCDTCYHGDYDERI